MAVQRAHHALWLSREPAPPTRSRQNMNESAKARTAIILGLDRFESIDLYRIYPLKFLHFQSGLFTEFTERQ
jgi:hypothetical protein